MEFKIKKVLPDVNPRIATSGSAGIDLQFMGLRDGHTGMIRTGVAVEIPQGHVGLLFIRSGWGTALKIHNAVGVIDSDYRGEIYLNHIDDDDCLLSMIRVGEYIAQLVIVPSPKLHLEFVEELSSTERGEGGFGSSGK